KHRRRTTPSQLKILEFHFDRNPKPDITLRKQLSEQLDMTPREVQVWFQNRRAKTKK
ncbi:homeobox, partial [Meredithblackwellia eburnea MCA 4105]